MTYLNFLDDFEYFHNLIDYRIKFDVPGHQLSQVIKR